LQQSHNAIVTSNFHATIAVAICTHEPFTSQNLNPFANLAAPRLLTFSHFAASSLLRIHGQRPTILRNSHPPELRTAGHLAYDHLNHKSITHFRNLPLPPAPHDIAGTGVTNPQSWWELLHTNMSKSSSYSNARPKDFHMKKSRSCASRNGLERRNGE
jgi:hypothetical protein